MRPRHSASTWATRTAFQLAVELAVRQKGQPGGICTGWLTKNGKTYYYSASTHKPVTGGIQSVDGKLYYFDADGVMQKNVNFGIDVSKYQSNIDWNKVKKAGVNFVIIRIGYRGYGASGTLVQGPCLKSTSPMPATRA